MTEPSNGELVRRVEEVSRQLVGLAADMRRDRERSEETYVRRDVYAAQRQADLAEVRAVEKDVEEVQKAREADMAWRRQVLLALAVAALAAVASFAIAVLQLVTG